MAPVLPSAVQLWNRRTVLAYLLGEVPVSGRLFHDLVVFACIGLIFVQGKHFPALRTRTACPLLPGAYLSRILMACSAILAFRSNTVLEDVTSILPNMSSSCSTLLISSTPWRCRSSRVPLRSFFRRHISTFFNLPTLSALLPMSSSDKILQLPFVVFSYSLLQFKSLPSSAPAGHHLLALSSSSSPWRLLWQISSSLPSSAPPDGLLPLPQFLRLFLLLPSRLLPRPFLLTDCVQSSLGQSKSPLSVPESR